MTRNREILMDVCTALGIGGPDDPRNVKVDGAEISAATALGNSGMMTATCRRHFVPGCLTMSIADLRRSRPMRWLRDC